MARLLKGMMYLVVGIVVIAGLGVAGLYAWTNRELKVTVADGTHAFTAPTTDSAVARGEHVTRALAKCADCHGDDFGGKVMAADPAIGTIAAPNITTGRGSRVTAFADADFERAIRHGTAGDGRRLLIMPSNEYQHLSDDDVAAIIAYIRTVPPVDRDEVPNRPGPLARALYAAGEMPWFPADQVTHGAEVVAAVTVDSTVEYGKYLAMGGCSGCHGANYSGGKIQGAPPDWPMSANLTPTGLSSYDYAAFAKALTEGVRPDGSHLNPVMPVQATKLMTPVEMTAVWKYLQTLPPTEFGVR